MERQPLLANPEEEGISSYNITNDRISASSSIPFDYPSSWRNTMYRIIEGGLNPWDKVVSISIMILISINVILFILSTVDAIETAAGHVFDWIELISVTIFTMEYLLRLWCCVERLTFAVSGPILGRVRYVLTLSSIVDLISFIPYWTQFIIEWFRSGDPFNTDSVSFIAAIRILRVFQLFKANKYVHAIEILKVVFKRNRDILLTTGAIAVTLFLITATALYFSQQNSNKVTFKSIPDAMYTAVLLLSAQGFNGMDSMTPVGTWVVCVSCLFSIAIFAVPTSIFAYGFEDINEKYKEMRRLRREQARERKREAVEKARAKGIYIRTPPTSSDSEEDIPIPAPLSLNGAEGDTQPVEESKFVPAVRVARSFASANDDDDELSSKSDHGPSQSQSTQRMSLGDLGVRGRCPHCLHDVEFDLSINLKPKAPADE
eukprot:TRINITY_DN9839_c0_g1_i1.p1 TRINITY_DN9839_c0_g1~~TRINITY_DN9839_c0_g1_i1.p1  ORF type:complete len:432 (-),score=57.27 TRINITY_DN9839_c0_g1_i1:35-1330(-)